MGKKSTAASDRWAFSVLKSIRILGMLNLVKRENSVMIKLKDLLEYGGFRRWDPKMEKFIFLEPKNSYIVDLQKTLRYFKYVYNVARDVAAEGGTILFVGTNEQARGVVKEHADRCGMPYVTTRWLGGMLTNYPTIRKSIRKLEIIEQLEENGQINLLTQKEILMLRRKKEKLLNYLDGYRHMKKLPDMMFVIDAVKEYIAVKEARKLKIPVIAPLDTNCDPDLIDYPIPQIPGNNDTIRSISIFCREIANAILEGKEIYAEKQHEADEEKESEIISIDEEIESIIKESQFETKVEELSSSFLDNKISIEPSEEDLDLNMIEGSLNDSETRFRIERQDAESIKGMAKSGSGEKVSYKYECKTVFYATNRNIVSNQDSLSFGKNMDKQIKYGICNVTIPEDHRIGRIERPTIFRLEFSEDPSKHITIIDNKLFNDENSFHEEINNTMVSKKNESMLLFVHGFNVSFNDAAYRTAQISYDLEFDGVSMFYSWPSAESIWSYSKDEETSRVIVKFFSKIIEDIMKKTRVSEICFIAHSMGNRILTEALAEISQSEKYQVKISQIILAAPDIYTEIFEEIIHPKLKKFKGRMTLYASSKDKALIASKLMHGHRRLGESGKNIFVSPEIYTIDASKVDTSLMGHSYYGDNKSIISDIYYLIKHKLKPDSRHTLKSAEIKNYKYWVFSP